MAPAQRPLPQASLQPPKSGEPDGGVLPGRGSLLGGPPPLPEDARRNQPSPRGGRGRGGIPPGGNMGRGGPPPHHPGFPRPGSSGGMLAGNKPAPPPPGPSGASAVGGTPGQGLGVGSGAVPIAGGSGHTSGGPGDGGGVDHHHHHPPPPNRPDLQKLGLKFGGQISITSTGNQGKRGGAGGGGGGGGGTDAQGVSITKLKGDMPVGSPVSIRDATNKQQQQQGPAGTSGRTEDGGAGSIKVSLIFSYDFNGYRYEVNLRPLLKVRIEQGVTKRWVVYLDRPKAPSYMSGLRGLSQ